MVADRRVSCSLAFGLTNPISQAAEIVFVNCGRTLRCSAVEQELTQAFAILIGADQLADIFTARGIATFGYLLVDEGFQRVWQRNVHRAHDDTVVSMANFGKVGTSRPAESLRLGLYYPPQGDIAIDVPGRP